MAAVLTTGVKAQGNTKLNFVTTLASGSAATVTEVNAGTDLSCYLMGTGWNPAVNNNRGNTPPRLCTTIQFEQFGNTTYSIGDIVYSWQPQAAASTDGVKAWEILVPGTSGYFIERQGLNATTSNWTAGQFVTIWPVVLGQRVSAGDPTDEFAEFAVTQGVAVTAAPVTRVALT